MPTAVADDEVLPSERLPSDLDPQDKLPSDGGFDLSHMIKEYPVNQPSQFSSGSLMPGPEDTGLLRAAGVPLYQAAGKVWDIANRPIGDYFTETPQQRLIRTAREMSLAQEVSPQQEVGPNAAPVNPVVAGMFKGVEGLAKGFTSPIGIATLGFGSLPTAAQRAVSLAFATQMASQTPEIAQQLGTEFGKPEGERDNGKIADLLTQAGGTALMTGMAGVHGAGAPIGERFFPKREAMDQLSIQLKGAPIDYGNLMPPEVSGLPQNQTPMPSNVLPSDQAAQSKLNVPPDLQAMQPNAAPPETKPVQPSGQTGVAAAGKQASEIPPAATATVPETDQSVNNGPVVRTPDGQVDRIQTQIARMTQKQPTVADIAAANPDKPVTMGDLAQMATELKQAMTFNPDRSTPAPATAEAPENIEPNKQASKLSPNDLEPALMVNGEPVTGGDTHAEIASNYGNQPGADEMAALEALSDDKNHVFVDKSGKVYTRGEAAKALGETDPLQSQQLTQLKNGAQTEVARPGDASEETRAEQPPQTGNPALGAAPSPAAEPTIHTAAPPVKVADKADNGDVTLEDGKRFGVQKLYSGDSVYVQKHEEGGAEPSAEAVPKLRSGEKGTGSLFQGDEPFNLAGEKGVDVERAAAEKAKAADAGKANAEFQAKNTGDLFSQKANALADKLESLKSGVAKGGQLHAFGVAADLWDRAVEAAQKAIRAGGSVADAIEAAIQHIRDNFDGKFQEKEARSELQKQLGNETAAPERGVEKVKNEFASAKADLESKTSALTDTTKGTQFDRQQAANKAAANYRILRDELKEHPDYVAEQLGKQHAAMTEANDMLKPLGKSVNPEEMPDQAQLKQKLSPEQFRRYKELADQISGASTELQKMPVKLVDRVQNEMQADGRLPKGKQIVPEAGRTLDRMTQNLVKNNFDSPNKTFSERMAIGEHFANAVSTFKDAVTKTLIKSQAAWRGMVDAMRKSPTESDYKTVKRQWVGYDQRTAVENYQYAKALLRRVPNLDRQKAMSIWLDADGDEGLLRYQAQSVPEAYRRPFEMALKLTKDEQRIALDVKDNWAQKAEDAMNAGLMNRARENYGVPQRWKTRPERGSNPVESENRGGAGRPSAVLDTRDPFFSFQRETPSYYEGIMAGGKPENLALGHLVTVYDEAFHKALGSRGFVGALQESKAADGLPITKISGKATIKTDAQGRTTFVNPDARGDAVTADGRPYRSIDHPALKDWKFVSKDENGNAILLKGDMLVHPDYWADIKNELETPKWMRRLVPGETRNALESISHGALKTGAYLKASKFIGPFHNVTEALHASSHGVAGILADLVHGDVGEAWKNRGTLSPSVRGFAIDLKDPKQALLGRNMVLGFGQAREMFEDGLSTRGGIWSHAPILGDAVVKLNDFTFNEYIPRLKMRVGLAVLDRNLKRYGNESNPEQIAEITGRQMDAAFGGQNWRMIGANKTLIGAMRLGLVAPDFLISRSKVVGQAFTKYGAEQRYFLAAQAVGVYALSRVLNAILSDGHDPHFEPKNWDSVVIGKRAYHARFIVSDAAALARDMLGLGRGQGIPFISGRLGYVPKTAIEALTGKDLFTGQSKQLPVQTSGIFKALETVAVDTAGWMTPMAVDGFLPGSAGKGQTGPGQFAAALVGISSRKNDATGDIYDLAHKFNSASTDPATQRYVKEQDSSHPSDYQTLNNLLDANKLDAAKKEYQQLLATGRTPQAIRQYYNRNVNFTGNAQREQAFKASLSPQQQKIYQQAVQERQARAQMFQKVMAQ